MSIQPVRLSREDFPGQAGWIDKLLRAINTLASQASAFAASVPRLALVEQTVTVPNPSPAAGTRWDKDKQVAVKHGLAKCSGLVVVACARAETIPTEAAPSPYIDWEDVGDGRAILRDVRGLVDGEKYTLRLLAIGS